MPAISDPSAVPLSPVMTIVLMADGSVSVDGEALPTSGDPRVAGLREATIKAAFLGRPVRVNAKEVDGSTWPLFVDVDGTVTASSSPHPEPQPIVRHDWNAPPPREYEPFWEQIRDAETGGAPGRAMTVAGQLVGMLTQRYGADHPYTVNTLHIQGHLALVANDYPQAAWLHAQVARMREVGGAPYDQTLQAARNAHAAWKLIADPTTALHIGQQVLQMWQVVCREDPRPVASAERRLRELSLRVGGRPADA
ncbi:hypothetical protein [Streptantibioticus ferralitis]|uniref:Uncharacterized protein n=1 Tax=Streptantibioticus ferralitis TaxID=236510 RepID=A0ABT5Z3V9_9ACTN|nr:hypothetical protein [Streptantibioticus ferralitis]MDF2258520.1 hypothetical protein [Streptantibioticus ferralitis]